jgi:hypothetical protein
LLPQSSLRFAGAGTNRTLVILPATNSFGNAVITLTVTDTGGNSAQSSFALTVHPINDAPVISSISDQVIDEDTPTAPIAFTLRDVETPAAALLVTASSSNPLLLPQSSFLFGGTGTNRMLVILPATNGFGSAVITLTVTDTSGNSAQSSFLLTVNPVNDKPVISSIPDQVTDEDRPTASIAFKVGDVETSATGLVVTARSSDPLLLPQSSLRFAGAGTNRTLIILPATNSFGIAVVTLTVTDLEGSSSESSFLLTVRSVPDLPEILMQPLSQIVPEGSEVVLTVVTSGLGPFTYQWQRDGADLPGQRSDRLVLPSVHSADAASYRVIVSNPDASITSAPAIIQVQPPWRFLHIRLVGLSVQLSFATDAEKVYTVEYKDSLFNQEWVPLITQTGTGELLTIEDPAADNPTRFYRLRIEPLGTP